MHRPIIQIPTSGKGRSLVKVSAGGGRRRVLTGLCWLVLVTAAPANTLIRELFDDLGHRPGGDVGGRLDGPSSLGFAPNAPWRDNCTDYIKFGAFDVTAGSPDRLPGLPPTAGQPGGLWSDQWVFANPWQVYDSRIWATRPLAPSAWIHFDRDAVYYFTVRLNNAGDSAGGIGFASAGNGAGNFVGAGLIWDMVNHVPANYVYTSCGNLAKDSPYSICSHGAANAVNGKCLLLGRLVTRAHSAATLDCKIFLPGSTLPVTPSGIDWDATCHCHDQMTATHLLVWMNGTYPFEIDAIRLGTAYSDVTGLEIVSPPQAMPTNTVCAGWPVTNRVAAVPPPLTFQWRRNGVEIPGANSAALVMSHTAGSDAGHYDVVVKNNRGCLTSSVITLTILTSAPPVSVGQPEPGR